MFCAEEPDFESAVFAVLCAAVRIIEVKSFDGSRAVVDVVDVNEEFPHGGPCRDVGVASAVFGLGDVVAAAENFNPAIVAKPALEFCAQVEELLAVLFGVFADA